MILKAIISSWQELPALFSHEQAKLMRLITLKTVRDTYLFLIKYFWWVVGMHIGCVLLMLALGMGTLGMGTMEMIPPIINKAIILMIDGMWFLICLLVIRSSVAKKNSSYFLSYFKSHWFILTFPFVAAFISGILFFLVVPYGVLAAFFMLDEVPSFYGVAVSAYRAALMYVYNLPLWIALSCIMWLSSWLLSFTGFLDHILALMLLPSIIIIISNILLKRLHEHFDHYYYGFLFTNPEQKEEQ